MDAQDLKILGVILGVAIARWWMSRPPEKPSSPGWGADYAARYPTPPSLATLAGRAWGRASLWLGRRRR